MTKEFTLKFTMDNAAFDDGNNGRDEVAKILADVAKRVQGAYTFGAVRDSNGNTVGDWAMSED